MLRQIAPLALLLALACKRPGPAPAAPPPPPPAPAAQGCDRDLSGVWRHAADPSFTWHIADGRTRVELHPMGGAPDPDDPHAHHHAPRDGQARIALARAGGALAGTAESRARTLDGSTECPVSFRAWAVSCGESEIVLAMEHSYNVGPDCEREASGAEPDMATHRLVRAP